MRHHKFNRHKFSRIPARCFESFLNFFGFDRFSNLQILKNTARADDFEDLCICFMIALEADLGPILARFWNPKSCQNRSQEGPEWVWKSWSILNAFRILQESIFGQHDPNMAPTCPPIWSQVGTKNGSKSVRKRFRNRSRCQSRFGIDF